ncbi:hypothetical protein MMC16_006359 [Acarospora aff. strigata]|nr:hypothetical protein [Acarospora aff. strigata]
METLLYSIDKEEKHSRHLARLEVVRGLLDKRLLLLEEPAWGRRCYETKELEADGPPPKKHPDFWIWPSVDPSSDDPGIWIYSEILGDLLSDLDDDWSGIVKLFFLTLDSYHGGSQYTLAHRSLPRNARATTINYIEHQKCRARVLLDYIDRAAFGVLQQQLTSSWFLGLLKGVEAAVSALDESRGLEDQEEGPINDDTAPYDRISITMRQIMGSISWWTGEILRYETFGFEERGLSKVAVEDVERMLSQVCRSLGKTRRDEWVDEERQRVAGHFIIATGD